jgi:hypothetical protein
MHSFWIFNYFAKFSMFCLYSQMSTFTFVRIRSEHRLWEKFYFVSLFFSILFFYFVHLVTLRASGIPRRFHPGIGSLGEMRLKIQVHCRWGFILEQKNDLFPGPSGQATPTRAGGCAHQPFFVQGSRPRICSLRSAPWQCPVSVLW